jgi:CRP/FNR family cyclic AMP-dependent transcriptional regulator
MRSIILAMTLPVSSLGLRNVVLLQGLGPHEFDALAQACVWRSCEAGERIVSREDAGRDVYLVVSGRVRVTTYSAAGKQVTFRDTAAGEHFGEVAALDGLPRSADVVAVESSLLAVLSRELFQRLLAEHPPVAQRMMAALASLVRRLSERVLDLSTLSVQQRLHIELLRLAHEAGVRNNTARFDPAPRHADLASQVSTYREQVSRELSALQKSGLIAKDGQALVVCDVKRLQQLVDTLRSAA